MTDEPKRFLTQQAAAPFRRHRENLRQEIRLVAEAVTRVDQKIEREVGRLDEKFERSFPSRGRSFVTGNR